MGKETKYYEAVVQKGKGNGTVARIMFTAPPDVEPDEQYILGKFHELEVTGDVEWEVPDARDLTVLETDPGVLARPADERRWESYRMRAKALREMRELFEKSVERLEEVYMEAFEKAQEQGLSESAAQVRAEIRCATWMARNLSWGAVEECLLGHGIARGREKRELERAGAEVDLSVGVEP